MRKNKQKKTYDDDDGRVIANMNIDGMPWYVEKASEKREADDGRIQMTKQEEHAMIRGVVLASLLVTGVFVLGALLFILFCIFVWFK